MKTFFLSATVGALTLATAAARAEQAAPTAAQTSAKPTYGTYGFDTAGMDRSVKPGDDFYEYANGTWAKNTPIPADKSNFGAFTVLEELSQKRTRGILETAQKDRTSKIGNAYASFMDKAAVEAKGLAPIQPWLAEIKGIADKNA